VKTTQIYFWELDAENLHENDMVLGTVPYQLRAKVSESEGDTTSTNTALWLLSKPLMHTL